MVSFPFMNVVISAPKPLPEGYPEHVTSVGDHIRKKRMDLGLYQRHVAETIGVSEGAVELWELRGYEPHPHSWPGVISFLGYDPFPPPKTTAEKIKAVRRRLGLTSRELAKQLQADRGAITRWEAGGEIRKMRHRSAIEDLLANLGLEDSTLVPDLRSEKVPGE